LKEKFFENIDAIPKDKGKKQATSLKKLL